MKSVAYAANAKFSFAFKCFSKVLRPFGTPTRYLYHTHPCRNHYIPMHGVEWWASLYIINVPMRLGKRGCIYKAPLPFNTFLAHGCDERYLVLHPVPLYPDVYRNSFYLLPGPQLPSQALEKSENSKVLKNSPFP